MVTFTAEPLWMLLPTSVSCAFSFYIGFWISGLESFWWAVEKYRCKSVVSQGFILFSLLRTNVANRLRMSGGTIFKSIIVSLCPGEYSHGVNVPSTKYCKLFIFCVSGTLICVHTQRQLSRRLKYESQSSIIGNTVYNYKFFLHNYCF